MSLLERLKNRLQRTEEKPKEVDTGLKDILFDWLNSNNDSVESFRKAFLEPCIQFYLRNEQTQKYFEDYPEKAYEQYFDQHAILYLAAKYPDNKRFKSLLDYLMDKNNRAYVLRDSLRSVPPLYKFKPESSSLWEVLQAGNTNLKIYHAIYDKRDQNISYMASLPGFLKPLMRYGGEGVFSTVVKYFNQQDFEDRLYVLSAAIPAFNLNEYNADSVNVLKLEKRKALNTHNHLDPIQISEKLSDDYHHSFNGILGSQTYLETDYKKRKYLKLGQFPAVVDFIEAYAAQKDSIIKYYLLTTGLTYLSKELNNIHKGFYRQLHNNLHLSPNSFLSIIAAEVRMNHTMIYNNLLAPILIDVSIIEDFSEDLVDQFESKLLQNISRCNDIAEFQPCFNAILQRKLEEQDGILQSLRVAKYNQLYGEVNFNQNWIKLNINSKQQGGFVINRIIERLNLLFPSSLKSLPRNIQHVYYEGKLCTLNIDGIDYDFTNNIIIELNEILEAKATGYRFLPLVIHKTENERNLYVDQSEYKCSIELLNHTQFEVYHSQLQARSPLSKANTLIQKIIYINQSAPLLDYTGSNDGERDSSSFKDAPTWKWFKDDYVDKLESSAKWYPIMDLLIQCKGSTKPNKQWSKQINEAISEFGKERYFKELGSLISNSLKESFWYLDNYRTTIKGIIWSCSLNPNAQSLSIIKTIVEKAYTKIPGVGPKSTALGNLGLNAFILSKDDEAFGIMTLLRNRSKYQRFIKAIDRSLEKYLADSPGDPEVLADKTIPDFGFIDNRKIIELDEKVSAVFSIKKNRLSRKWMVNQEVQNTTPSFIKDNYKAHEKEIAAEFKRINSVYKQLKDRIKTYWLYNRQWEYDLWKNNIFNHPLLKSYLETLIWSNETKGQTFIWDEGKFVQVNNQEVRFEPKDMISLWHPVVANSTEISNWQGYIYENQINQTLRQAFREHYPFSVEELNMEGSERFAHHFLAVRKLMAIANSAGWVFTYVHEGYSWPRKFIKPLNLTVHLECDYQRTDYAIPTKEMYITDENTLKLNGKQGQDKKKLSEIPLVTLSEICRDIDLFIATTSIANDPELSLKTEEQRFYRDDFNKSYFSDNSTAKIRRQVITVLAPSIGLVPTFEKNYLIVEGKLAKYRINLGSGFAQIAKSQKHINLLPDIQPMKKSRKVHSPIQDDETLYIILAKAKLLLNDNQIKDDKFREIVTT